MSFISINFSTLFIKEIGNLVQHWKELKNLPNLYLFYFYIYLCTARVSFKLSLYFFRLQAALVTNALIPTSIFVSYYCRMSSSNSEKGEIEISLIVVGAPKLREKEDDADLLVLKFKFLKSIYCIWLTKF